jgi:tRNA (guanine37-N1)-methyltransferase
MVLRAEPILRTLERDPAIARPLIALTPSGRVFTHAVAVELAALEGFSLLCGRYEGIDQRAIDLAVDDEVSLGDFILAGGELAALCVIEAVVRLRPGALGNDASSAEESFSDGLLEYPHYTQPAEVRGVEVPEVLRSGDHARIARWRRAQALHRTMARRPDLIAARGGLSTEDEAVLAEFPVLEAHGRNG